MLELKKSLAKLNRELAEEKLVSKRLEGELAQASKSLSAPASPEYKKLEQDLARLKGNKLSVYDIFLVLMWMILIAEAAQLSKQLTDERMAAQKADAQSQRYKFDLEQQAGEMVSLRRKTVRFDNPPPLSPRGGPVSPRGGGCTN